MIEFQSINNPGYHLQPEFSGSPVDARWVGKGTQLLGLPDQFDPVMYERLLHGRNPHDGEKLTARMKANRRLGWDVTLTNEKEVSALELVAGDDRIGKLREDALDYAVGRLEKQIAVRVRKGGKNEDRTTGNLVGAAFPHETNRLGEPHGHWHVCVSNLSFDHKERQWKAVELGQVDRNKLQRDFHKFMADGMKKLGYQVKFYGSRYDVQGVPEEVVDRLSTRRNQIKGIERDYDQSAAEKGTKGMDAKARAKLSLYDRPPKVGNGTRSAMVESWTSQLTDFHHHALRNMVGKARRAVGRNRWLNKIKVHALHTRRNEISRDTPEREQERGRGR
jgi:conjugative relaxase-like TrwC/TraI family protein